MKYNPNNHWNPEVGRTNSEINLKNVEKTIEELRFNSEKILVCGRGVKTHPEFSPRFSVPTVDIDSELYVSVDMSPANALAIKRSGKYALSLIVDPSVPIKIKELGGQVYWFSPEYLDLGIPKINAGKFPYDNSGLAAISIAAFLNAQKILISGIKLDGKYKMFKDGGKKIFEELKNSGKKIYSLDGILAEKISYNYWKEI
tara:strand:+ start:16 stop:618 length:603 start_codon:yes stop_codon:yes gene_type:complete